MNKKVKQILAIIGIVIIVGLYITTFILAITGDENTHDLFIASIFATVVIPVMIYVIQWLYKLIKGQAQETRTKDLVVNTDEKDNKES